MLKSSLKSLAKILLGDYSIYYIYASSRDMESATANAYPSSLVVRPIDRDDITQADVPTIRSQSDYAGPGSYSFGCYLDECLVGVCFYWYGPRYSLGEFWPIAGNEAKLVQIFTRPDARNQGVAKQLISESWNHLARLHGIKRAFARIWHSNAPSLRAFQYSSWQRVALIVEINPFRRPNPTRLRTMSALFGCRPLTDTAHSPSRPLTAQHAQHSFKRVPSGASGDAPSGRS